MRRIVAPGRLFIALLVLLLVSECLSAVSSIPLRNSAGLLTQRGSNNNRINSENGFRRLSPVQQPGKPNGPSTKVIAEQGFRKVTLVPTTAKTTGPTPEVTTSIPETTSQPKSANTKQPSVYRRQDEVMEMSEEYLLYRRLLSYDRYQRYMRPVRSHDKAIVVKVGMCVMMIEEIVERDQILAMAVCIKLRWRDSYLQWDPEDYNNLTWMAVPSTVIWLPDIAIINSPEPYQLTRKPTNVELQYTGDIGFYPSGKLITRCSIQIRYFPLDWQRCEVRLESWIYPTDHLIMETFDEHEAVDIKEYYVNHEWSIEGYDVIPQLAFYDGKNFSSITFAFVLRRKPTYYFTYFVFPQLLLALMQTLSSTLPVEHPGRMAMLTSLFIGTSVTQAGVTDLIPKSSESMSLLQIYMQIMSCNIVVALIVTCIMMYSVLRYPNEEPSLTAIFVAFFSIAWPSKADHYHKIGRQISKRLISCARQETLSVKSGSGNSIRRLSIDVKNYQPDAHDTLSSKSDELSPTELANFRKYLNDQPHLRHHSKESSAAAKRLIFASRKIMTNEGLVVNEAKDIFSHTPPPAASCDLSPSEEYKKNVTPEEGDSILPKPIIPQLFVSYAETPEDEEIARRNRMTFRQHRYDDSPSRHLAAPRQLNYSDSAAEMMANGFVSINPNIETDRLIGSQVSSSPNSDDTPRSRSRPKRGEASASDETRELKRRWLLYCVALDKTFMYANLAWNIIVPIVLFGIIPQITYHPLADYRRNAT